MTVLPPPRRSEFRDGMRVDWDVAVPMDDGVVLRADVFRPDDAHGRYPVLLTYGPYAKGLPFQRGYPSAWERMAHEHPDVTAGSTNAYQNWEVVDPEKWVPEGYVCVRVDSRGCGRSPGYLQHFSPRETRDFHDCIEWAAAQPWSTGKVGLNGVSYYAMNQWQVAALQPPHLAAMCAWEGASDWYRDATHHGGIVSTFWQHWYDMQAKTVQHGVGPRGGVDPSSGLAICGDDELSAAELEANRVDFGAEILAHPLIDTYHRERTPDWPRIVTPLLSAGNWGGQGLHLRGNVEGYVRAAAEQKWLELHGSEHWTHFYTDYGRTLQLAFFDHFLKGADNGWPERAPVQLNVRHADGGFAVREEREWPLARTEWTKLYLDAATQRLRWAPVDGPARIEYEALGDGVTFRASPLVHDTEITGPLAARLTIASSTVDADLFLVFRVFAPDGEEVVFQGAIDPHTPVAQGWLRASHRKLDEALSTPYRPFHSHDEPWPLTPGEPVDLTVELLPTSIVVPRGYTLALSVRGRDYEYPGPSGGKLSNFKNELRGCGPFLHDDPVDRSEQVFGGTVTLHTGGADGSYVLIPVVP